MKRMLPSILFLCVVATFGWIFFMYVLKPMARFSFIETPIRTFIYFALLSSLILVLFYSFAWRLISDISVPAFIFFVVVIGFLNPWIYRFITNTYRSVLATLAKHRDLELVGIDTRFLFSKFGDVFFQQVVLGTLILMLSMMQIPFLVLTALSAGVFFIGHFGLLFRLPHEWALYFIFSALVGGAFFPYLILYLPGGFYYAVALHMFWYVMTGALYVSQEGKTAQKAFN